MVQRDQDQYTDDPPSRNGENDTDTTTDEREAASPEADGLQAQLSEERTRANGYLAQWQRVAADYQNLKRRTEQEREEFGRYANVALITNILPAVDDFDRALANVDPLIVGAGAGWVDGMRAIQRKLRGALEASGVTEIRAEGEPFDPNIHEAIGEAPGESGTVVNEVQRGYRLGNRVIRPAMVMVGNGQAS